VSTEPARILVVNAGSSSLKLRVVDAQDAVVAQADLPSLDATTGLERLTEALRGFPPVDAVGHRVVHGGDLFRAATLVTDEVLSRLRSLSDLAPLHNPAALAALDAVRDVMPSIPHVACFDTAFHASLPPAAYIYAVLRQWTEEWGIRRYGFHGLNHAYVGRRAAELLGRSPEELRTVSCHLGAGASLTAIAGGRSVDTTMGFTPLEGLVMATRSGSVDPGALLYVQRRHGLDAAEVERILDEQSGLLGISGRSGDMRDIEDAMDAGDARAQLAFDVYIHRLRGGIAAMVAAMDGLEVLVFTGGVGEHSARVRSGAVEGLTFLGLRLDEQHNHAASDVDALLSGEGTVPAVLLVHAREDLEIAREVRAALA
jgi:acetate kinase